MLPKHNMVTYSKFEKLRWNIFYTSLLIVVYVWSLGNEVHAHFNDSNKLMFVRKIKLRTTAHQSMVQVFSGAGQPQTLSGLDGAGDRPQAVLGHHYQLHHGGKGRVWSCCPNPRPAAAASAAGALPWSWPAEDTTKHRSQCLRGGSKEATKE